jgi:hypothetical protein
LPIERDILDFFIGEVAQRGLPEENSDRIDPMWGHIWLVDGERTLTIDLNRWYPISKESAATAFLNICQVFFDPKFASRYPMDLIEEDEEGRDNPWGNSAWTDEGFRYHPEIPWVGVDKIALTAFLKGNVDPSFGTAPLVSMVALETRENFRRVDPLVVEKQAFYERCLKQGQGFEELLKSWISEA